MHRDIKPENLMLRHPDSFDEVVIIDLGLAKKLDDKTPLYLRCGTPGFVAPEILNLEDKYANYTEKCDVFSLGIIFYAM